MVAVLPIYVANQPQPPLGVFSRLVAGVVAAMCLAVLITAARLTPDPRGVETHLQLGLAPCAPLRDYGVPCFACGMTTSFAHLARGQVLQSLLTQPAGATFGFATAMGVWIGTYVAATGRPSAKLLNTLPVLGLFFAFVGVGLVGWAYKIVVVIRSAHD